MEKKKEVQKESEIRRGISPLYHSDNHRGNHRFYASLLVGVVILLSGCNPTKKMLRECDITPYSLYQDVIMKEEIPVAHLEPLELSLDGGKLVYEAKIIIDFDEELTLKILDDIRFYDKFIGQLVVDTIISVQDKEYKLVKKVWDGDNNTVIYWFSK